MSDTQTLAQAGAPPSSAPLEIRHLRSWTEFQACVALQQEVWGVSFADLVPASILKVTQRVGGVTAGAFEPDGRLVGFVYGLTGVEDGRLVHWSDMLGVTARYRDHGVGRALKEFQRDTLRGLGVSVIYWTYDPLVARNAHLNLNQLGTEVVEYVVDMYGPSTSSVLHEGIGTDRFVVAWHIDDRTPRRPVPPVPALDAPDIPTLNGAPHIPDGARWVRVRVPLHIDRVQQASLSEAARWRAETRPAFQNAFARGYRVAAFQRDDTTETGVYTLVPDPPPRSAGR